MRNVFSEKKTILIFILPTLLLYTAFVLFPILYNIYISLYRTDLMSPGVFIGIKNYTNLLNDNIFKKALTNNLLLVLGSFLAHFPLALFFGNAIFTKIRGSKFFQTVFFVPCVICGTAVGLMFQLLYNNDFGLVNSFLDVIGLSSLKQGWLTDKNIVMFSLIFVVMWRFVGYHMVIQVAAMKAIPGDLYEAAEIDGASPWVQFSRITFPLIKNILKVDAVLIITGSLKYFDIIQAMTKGGPDHASEVMATYMFYTGFRTLKFGYASAIGIILLILCVLVIKLVDLVFKKEDLEY